uniref:Uncharacterized protein n=1 Tax=Arundo donax TaxID=35708 RepID=A0A0A9AYR0_ARUDO
MAVVALKLRHDQQTEACHAN